MEDDKKIEISGRESTDKERKSSYVIRLTDREYSALAKETGKEKTELLRFIIDDRERLKVELSRKETLIREQDRALKERLMEMMDLEGDNGKLRNESLDKGRKIRDVEKEKSELLGRVTDRVADLEKQKGYLEEANNMIEKYKGGNGKLFSQREHLRISNRYARGASIVFLLTWALTIAFAELHIYVILEYAEAVLILALAITAITSVVSFTNSPEIWYSSTYNHKQ